MRLAFVIQRYGTEIVGGAEYFARIVAEHLKDQHQIEILTTRAKGYHTWENEYPEPEEWINGIKVRRFPNARTRDMNDHVAIQERVFYARHTRGDEQDWVDAQGPFCPDLIRFIKAHSGDYDCFVFFTYRYYPTMAGVGAVREKAILVPFAENDPALTLSLTQSLFREAAGIIYCTPEERDLIRGRVDFDESRKPWDIIGCGIENPLLEEEIPPGQITPYLLYVGRIEGSKGCYQLFEYYQRLISEWPEAPDLLLAGFDAIRIPDNPKIRYLGFLQEGEKRSLMKHARILVMPSPFESFSLVTLESMACGTPVLVNGDCEVLKGHCIRSNAGLWYQNYEEFREGLMTLCTEGSVREAMSRNGIRYVRNAYSWDIVRGKYLRFFERMVP